MIPIQNIYYMLSYAFQVLNEQGYRNVATEHFENVADLCAAILIKGLSKQLKRGLMKDYIPKREPLTALRGARQNGNFGNAENKFHYQSAGCVLLRRVFRKRLYEPYHQDDNAALDGSGR